jgi:DNA-binding response OmpR family regulator
MGEKLNKKILIVEDEAPLRNAVTDILSFEGFTVFQAKNGQEGLDLALKEHPDHRRRGRQGALP